ncbi:MAG: 2-dehydro-3-deoxyphosphogluconate aldolase [Acidobacteria bacterium]|nr:MAG: 2-dehydro-3-deoxyphosphogluconate aldolase [Acidobacteriota bacterium]PYV74591.1 MAG: 2-dehydro-3-deoxyphosphogluconate aldolase [Acidobacteriota bacterium]PYV77606.1 MAG: 2-dehydro-3-deoxyphosphogluconate aldolase [Acidobacteriota bacterium]
MTREEISKRIVEVGIVPIVRATSSAQARRAAEAVCAGGIPIVEVTMTVPGAIELIKELVKSLGAEVLIGAGTVLDAGTAQRCIDTGAEFIVAPGFDSATVQLVKSLGKPMMSGALTPTEVIAAWRAGSDFVKIFPCGTVGGPKYIKALKAPLPQIPMIPTGGVNLNTAAEFIQAGAVALGIGGELVSTAALKAGDMKVITEAAQQFIRIVREARASAVNSAAS